MKKLSRRSFIHASALGVGAATIGSGKRLHAAARTRLAQADANASAAVSANEKVSVALIGCGGMGLGDLKTFFMNPEVVCPVVCDVDDSHLAQAVELVKAARENTPDTVKDFRRVLERNDVDAVLVATPDHWHALPTVLACQAGKDVYVEKPLANSIDEGRAMLEAMRQNKRVVQMGTQWRSAKHWGEAVAYVHSGKLGKIRMVRAWAYLDWVGGIGSPADAEPPAGVDYDMWLGPSPLRPFNPNRFHFNFRWFWDYAGGLMTDWGVHLLNICQWAMGHEPPRAIYSTGGKYVVDDNTETPDTQFTIYEFPAYNLIWEHQMLGGLGPNGRPHGALFNGSRGTLIADADGWEVIPEPKFKSIEPEKHEADGDGRPEHVRNFLDCVKTREQPVENLDIGHAVSTVAHLGNISLRSGRQIVWDSKTERISNDPDADALVGRAYRAPWTLPYMRRG